jgi:hypothetical protein
MASISRLSVLIGAAIMTPALLCAQSRPVELGLDGGLSISFNGGTRTTVSVPFQEVRAGFFVIDDVSIEPAGSLSYIKIEDIDAIATLGFDLAFLFHFTPDRSAPQPYFRPVAGLTFVTAGGENASQFNVGGGFGVKLPATNQLAVRLEARFRHNFENDDFAGVSTITAVIGLSFFTK